MALSYSSLLFTIFFALLKMVAAQSGCFWPNGTENPSLDDYKPCRGSGLSTVCCSSIRDVCLDNGLCRANTGYIWRETCTSRDWETSACQDLCTYNAAQKATDQIVTPCDGTENSTVWCCGESDSCCGHNSTEPRYTIAKKFAAAVSTTSSTLTSIVVSTSSTTPTINSVIAVATNNAKSDTGLSTGAKVGTGVGAVVGALALIGLGMFIARALQWRKKLRAKSEDGAPSGPPASHGASALHQAEDTPVVEMEHTMAKKPISEICGRQADVQELSASNER
ncbi:hypothetical protein BU25DRAFT_153203 [Macroventuria anomochaeta]|uniref:Uncharacterized protein n=1 Tax=Macroventuria anomochaeta TaxID=301207 RepID=A0ACB6RRR9_9PLEO|nr:uncharacterized protein BU25DRAFT_153203 [Macroventuria anomochaeta]KAF2624469.1 hypothetical protein BU25DRAFT_153203 [Macroventuria anomochaeta]